jgi:hypothetical protein
MFTLSTSLSSFSSTPSNGPMSLSQSWLIGDSGKYRSSLNGGGLIGGSRMTVSRAERSPVRVDGTAVREFFVRSGLGEPLPLLFGAELPESA